MLFNSGEFAIFFPIAVAIYFLLAERQRNVWLLISSCAFYMAFIPSYILILLLTILIDYFAGIFLEKVDGPAKKWLLWLSILSTCLVLVIFKYFDFLTGNVVAAASLFGVQLSKPALDIILPIGLSFHTFQSLSYVVEVYRGHQRAEKNFVVYATFVMFFPQLVAGPIERPQNLLHQFFERHGFDGERITSGLRRMAWGFFKKLVIADRLALYVNDVYASPQSYNGLQLSLATFFFAYQIYCDFSGYSDIAIGSARVLGFRLMENFNTPYYSKSITEFWHRWHISLSSWFRDYLYNPMVGQFLSPLGWVFTILVTFGVSGLWHGASWTYVVWGLLNGTYLLLGSALEAWRNRAFAAVGISETSTVRTVSRIASTFLLTCVGWVVFRAQSLPDVAYILTHFWRGWDFGSITTPNFLMRQMPVALGSILLLEAVQLLNGRVRLSGVVTGWSIVPRWGFYLTAVFVTVMFGVFRSTQFIYFQF